MVTHTGGAWGRLLKNPAARHSVLSCEASIHRVSALANECGLVLGQEKVSDRSNEIAFIPDFSTTGNKPRWA